MTAERLDLDDVVAVAAIVSAIVDRPLTPFESSRLKSAYHRSRSLVDLADALAA